MMYTDFYLGVDVGVAAGRNPTASALLRRRQTNTEPVLEVCDLARASGVSFGAVATEVERIIGAVAPSKVTVILDATGPGIGALQQLRGNGIWCVGATISGTGSSVSTRPGGMWTVPSTMIFESLYRLMAAGRLAIPHDHPLTDALLEELEEVTPQETPSGNLRYDGSTPGGGHLDLCTACGLAAVAAERHYTREVNIRAWDTDGERPRSGRRRLSSAPRRNPLAGRNSWRESMNLLNPLGKNPGW